MMNVVQLVVTILKRRLFLLINKGALEKFSKTVLQTVSSDGPVRCIHSSFLYYINKEKILYSESHLLDVRHPHFSLSFCSMYICVYEWFIHSINRCFLSFFCHLYTYVCVCVRDTRCTVYLLCFIIHNHLFSCFFSSLRNSSLFNFSYCSSIFAFLFIWLKKEEFFSY